MKPTIRALGFFPIRIDEIQHNENIDQRILTEIDKASVVVADLTYARPSVYYEAGYAQGRGLPVVFTSRADHLAVKLQADDLRIHFDLRQRNIVPWSSPSDPSFGVRFRAHLTPTVRPLVRKRRQQEQDDKAARNFASISHDEKRRRLSLIAIRRARSAGFWNEGTQDGRRIRPAEIPATVGWLGYKPWRTFVKTILILVLGEVGKRALGEVARDGYSWMSQVVPTELRGRMNIGHLILVSLASVPSSRVESAIPDLHGLKDWEGTRVWVRAHQPLDGSFGGMQTMYLHLIDHVRSEDHLAEVCRGVFTTMGRGRPGPTEVRRISVKRSSGSR
jgi:hypothetical protein